DVVESKWSEDEVVIAREFIAHATALRSERQQAQAEKRAPRIVELVNGWGGVTIAYRRRLVDSPSYTLNHEEVEKALEEGIRFAENLTPASVVVDEFGYACGLSMRAPGTSEDGSIKQFDVTLPARTVLVAAGTQPNTVLAREDPHHFTLDGRYFQACDESGHPVKPEKNAKPGTPRVLLSRRDDGRFVSFFGDLHPSF